MKYWQHDETGRLATSSDYVDLSPRYYEISKEAYDHAAQQGVQSDVCPLGGLHNWQVSEYVENYSWCGKCGTRR